VIENTELDNQVDAWMRARHDELVGFAQDLVRTPTENRPPTGDELAGQNVVSDRLAGVGGEIDRFTPDDVNGLRAHPAYYPTVAGRRRDFTNRPNVVATFRGRGGGRSVLFSTHIDTVPAQPFSWSLATPFGAEILEGRLYGRGSYDAKAALASQWFALRCIRDLSVELRGDVIIESVVDEEFGGSHGALAARMRGHNADIAFNTEPTNLDVCPAHRGGREAYLRITGAPGMAFAGETLADPVTALAHAINAMVAFNEERNHDVDVPEVYDDDPTLPLYFNQVGGGGTTYEETIGTPAECYVHFWAEVHEGTTAAEFDSALLDRVHRAFEGLGYPRERVGLEPTTRFLPGSSISVDHPAFEVLRHVYETLEDRPFHLRGAPFACDTYVFNLYSPTPALTLGPGGGGAHAPNEYVLISDLLDLARIYARFIVRWCA
jgi:acetylornithine deacetylase